MTRTYGDVPLDCFGAMRLAMTQVRDRFGTAISMFPAQAGNQTENTKQGPHPTLSLRERARNNKPSLPLRERGVFIYSPFAAPPQR
jgi:hypothetical protein